MRDLDPGWQERVRDSFGRQPMMSDTLGASIETLEPGRIVMRMHRRPELTQQHGYLHAGAIAAFADSACGYAAYSLAPPGHTVLTVEFKINLLAPARGDTFFAAGHVVKAGRTLSVATATVTRDRPDHPEPIAQLHATLMLFEGADN